MQLAGQEELVAKIPFGDAVTVTAVQRYGSRPYQAKVAEVEDPQACTVIPGYRQRMDAEVGAAEVGSIPTHDRYRDQLAPIRGRQERHLAPVNRVDEESHPWEAGVVTRTIDHWTQES